MSSDRLNQFKNFGKDSEELRRRRTDVTIELRKRSKDDQLSKRRNIDVEDLDGPNSPLSDATNNSPMNTAQMQAIIQDVMGTDPKKQLESITLARKMLSRERHPPIDVIIKTGIVPRCIEFLHPRHGKDLQFEAAWVLTNIASGTSEQTNYVVDAGAIEPFIEMLRSPYVHIAEQACWALGNCIGDGPVLRDRIISKGIIPPLVALVKSHSAPSFLRNVAWTLSNVCRGKQPPPAIESTRACLPALARLIMMEDSELISDACWALSYLTDGSNEKIDDVVNAGVVKRLVELLHCTNFNVVTPCLRAVGNVVTGSDAQTEIVVKCGVLEALSKLLQTGKPSIVKEAAWAVSNIAAGTHMQITRVMDGGLIELLVNVIRTGDVRSQKEAIWAITNITTGGTVEHLSRLCELGVVTALCDVLQIQDWRTLSTVLDGLENILRCAGTVGQLDKIGYVIEECGGLDKIEQLQNHKNSEIYTKCYSIIEKYFSEDNDEEVTLQPTVSESGEYQMNVNMAQSEIQF